MAEKVEENMTSSIDEEREEMNKLNAQLATYKVMKETKKEINKHILTEMNQMKAEFLRTQLTTEEKYANQIKKMESIRKKSVEGAALEAKLVIMEKNLEMKNTEICDLKTQTLELQEKLQEKDETIGNLKVSCNALKNQKKVIKQKHDRIKEDFEKIWEEQETTLTNQTKAQTECESLQKEKTHLEKILHDESEKFRKLLSTVEFSQQNFKEIQNTVYTKCIKEIQAEYDSHFAKLKKEQQGLYKEKIERLEEVITSMTTSYEEKCISFERERYTFQQQINQMDKDLREQEQRSSVRVGNLRTEISTYRKLLVENIEIEDNPEPQEEDISSQTGQQTNEASDKIGPDKSPSSSEEKKKTALGKKDTDGHTEHSEKNNEEEGEDSEPKTDDTEARAGQQAKEDTEHSRAKQSSSSSEEDEENDKDEKTKFLKKKSRAFKLKEFLDPRNLISGQHTQ